LAGAVADDLWTQAHAIEHRQVEVSDRRAGRVAAVALWHW
jgi:hypothetical protein